MLNVMNSINNKNISKLTTYRRYLPFWVLGAVVLGSLVGIFIKNAGVTPNDLETWNVGLPGDLFLRLLKMVVVPLIIAAIINGVSGTGDLGKLGKLGVWTTFYYIGTTAISVAIGLVLVNLINPGVGIDLSIAGKVPQVLDNRGLHL